MKMKSETATVREREKGKCMQTAKEMHVKMTFKKVINVTQAGEGEYVVNTIQTSVFLFRKMKTVFLLRLMVCNIDKM